MPNIQPSILSIQVGKVAPLGPSGVLSGFVKRIVRGPVEIAPLGLTGWVRRRSGGFWENRGYEWHAGI
jgi:hypothetical protein